MYALKQDQTPSANPLKKLTTSLLSNLAEAITCEELHFTIPISF